MDLNLSRLQNVAVVIKPMSVMMKKDRTWVEVQCYKYYLRADVNKHVMCTAGVPAVSLESARAGAQLLSFDFGGPPVEERI